MNNATLAQATLLALTMQNQAFKVAPLSTARMQGQVINRNIAIGETVVCWMNNAGELTRVGDVPAHNGDFFVDDNNLMYYKKGSSDTEENNRLVVRDAFSGDIISDSDVCLRFVLSGDNQIAAYCTETSPADGSNDNPKYSKWVVIHKDGTRTQEITRPRPLVSWGYIADTYYIFDFGYRNGVIAICNTTSNSYGYEVSTYTKDGILVKNLYTTHVIRSTVGIVCPISYDLVCLARLGSSAYWGYQVVHMEYYTSNGTTTYNPCEGYISHEGYQTRWIGTDQVYCYIAVRICENQAEPGQTAQYVWLDEWDILRVEIDNYNVEKIKTIHGNVSYTGMASAFGHIIQTVTGDSTTRTMIDITTWDNVYVEALPNLPNTAIQENAGWIWIPGSGVYQKTPLDWLMTATGEYPKDEPWGRCGYAIGNYKVGQNGLAIVLFE